MAILVAGKLRIGNGARDECVRRSLDSVALARAHPACLDFAVSADPIDPTRINIFELWSTRLALDEFRSSKSEGDFFSLVESFDVSEYDVQISEG